VITRILTQPRDETGLSFSFSDYTPKASARCWPSGMPRTWRRERVCTPSCSRYSKVGRLPRATWIPLLQKTTLSHLVALRDDLKRIVSLTHRVMDQTARRVLHGEEVPAEEKWFLFLKDVCFTNKRGLTTDQMCRSEYVTSVAQIPRRDRVGHIMAEAMFRSQSLHLEVADFLFAATCGRRWSQHTS